MSLDCHEIIVHVCLVCLVFIFHVVAGAGLALVVVKLDQEDDGKHGQEGHNGEETEAVGVKVSSWILLGGQSEDASSRELHVATQLGPVPLAEWRHGGGHRNSIISPCSSNSAVKGMLVSFTRSFLLREVV